MRISIGLYDYNRVEENQLTVLYNDKDETQPTDRIVMIFVKNGDQIIAQGNIMDADGMEIYANAVKIFNGTISLGWS